MWNTKKKIQELKSQQWLESQSIRDIFYKEIDDLWERVYELEDKLRGVTEDDLPAVSKSRGCIKIIL
jgi:hypothetical protein